MMKELLKGPITCGIACSPEFDKNYSAGVFEDKTNFLDIDHDVEVVGWGEENGQKYWHIRNSWGTYWGMDGFFKIIRGKNNLGIESDCHYMIPDVSDEELVWNETPAYGGSLYGIKPYSDVGHGVDVPFTKDVVLSSEQAKVHELPPRKHFALSDAQRMDAVSSNGVSSFISGMGFIALGTVFGILLSRTTMHRYQSIN